MEDKKINDLIIGIVLGLTFLTKQNIGIYLCIPTLFTKDIKKILKRIIGFIIPNILIIIYLINNNCLYEFIDYTFLGISNFASENAVIYPSCLLFTVSILIYLIYKYIKTKDIKILYLICIQGLAYPLVDPYHVTLPFVTGLNYFLNELKLNKKIISYGFTIFIIIIFLFNLFQYSKEDLSYPNNTEVYKYRKVNNNIVISINNISNYIKSNEGKTYIIDVYAYLIKLESSIPINKYDLLNDGNLGKNGEKKLINNLEKICRKEKCTFLLNPIEVNNPKYSQYNQDIYNYIVKNYKQNDDILELTSYKNY